jgi:hypothetical protein
MCVYGPAMIIGAALFIGRGESTRGMYLEGAIGGVLLVGLILTYLGRLDTYLKPIRLAALREVAAADYSAYVGPVRLAFDEIGVRMATSSSEHRVAWREIEGIAILDETVTFTVSGSGWIVPVRVLEQRATEYLAEARSCWELASLSEAQRISRYMAEQELKCPRCGYNLRGLVSARCPECGNELTLSGLMELARQHKEPESP